MAATQVASLFGTLDLVDNFTGPLTAAQGKLSGFGSSLAGAGQKATRFGASMLPITIPLGLIGKMGIGTAADFDSSMAEISARTGIVGADLQRVSDFALQMGADTSFSAQQAADAFLQLLSSGQSVEEAMLTLPSVLNMAAASGEQLGFSADALTDIMAMYGLGVDEAAVVTDILAQAAGASSAEIGMLSQGFSNVGPVAAAFGMDVSDTAATLAVLSENGIKGAEAGTALKSMLLNMTRDTDTVNGVWEELGLSFYDAAGNARPLTDIVADLDEALSAYSAEDQNIMMQDLAGSYGIVALSALRGELSIEDMTEAMSKQAKASDVAAARMNTFKGRVDSLKGSVETLMIRAFTPFMNNVLTPLVSKLIPVVNTMAMWAANNPALTSTIISIGAGLIALSTTAMILGPILTFLGAGFGLLGVAMALILSPIGLIVVAVAGLYAAWQTNFLGIRDITADALATAQRWLDIIRGSFDFGGAISDVKSAIDDAANAVWNFVSKIPGWLIPGSPTPFEIGLRGIADAVRDVARAFTDMGIGTIVGGVSAALSILSFWIPALAPLKTIVTLIGVAFAAWKANFLGVQDVFGPFIDKIGPKLQALAETVIAHIPGLISDISKAAGMLANLYGPALSKMFDALGDAAMATYKVFNEQVLPVLQQIAPVALGVLLVSIYLLIQGVTWLADKWTAFANEHPRWAGAIVTIGLALGAVALIIGPVSLVIGVLTTVISGLAAVAGVAAAALFFLATPIGLIILLIGVLAVAYFTNFGGFKDTVDQLGIALLNIPTLLQNIIDVTNRIIVSEGLAAVVVAWTSIQTALTGLDSLVDNFIDALERIKVPDALREAGQIVGAISGILGGGGGGGGNGGGGGGNGGGNPDDVWGKPDGGADGLWWTPRASGGPVSAGVPYITGERGPELFIPGRSGTIVPNNRLALAGSGAGGGEIAIQNLYIQKVEDYNDMYDQLQRVARRRAK